MYVLYIPAVLFINGETGARAMMLITIPPTSSEPSKAMTITMATHLLKHNTVTHLKIAKIQ